MVDLVLEKLKPFARIFETQGKGIYLVGGALRNLELGLEPQDFDFATDATPQEVIRYFRRVIPTGLQHGTVTVLFQDQSFEVTTFRIDGKYQDHRRPENVIFSDSLSQDLSRRDFTINAMALNLVTGEWTDNYGGAQDIHSGVIRAIGDPKVRFDEDSLRILRMFRFAAQLGFSIEPHTLDAALSGREALSKVSRERVRDEWLKILGAKFPELVWPTLEKWGFLEDMAPLLAPRPMKATVYPLWKALSALQRLSVWLVLAAGQASEHWESALRALKFSNGQIRDVLLPIKSLNVLGEDLPEMVRVKKLLSTWESRSHLAYAAAVLNTLVLSGYLSVGPDFMNRVTEILSLGQPLFLGELALGGADLIQAGAPQGESLGHLLKALQRLIWEFPELNSRPVLLQKWKTIQ